MKKSIIVVLLCSLLTCFCGCKNSVEMGGCCILPSHFVANTPEGRIRLMEEINTGKAHFAVCYNHKELRGGGIYEDRIYTNCCGKKEVRIDVETYKLFLEMMKNYEEKKGIESSNHD